MFGAVEYIRRGAVHRHASGGGNRIGLLAGMQTLSFKFMLIIHFSDPVI
jgi:hypothetical protein